MQASPVSLYVYIHRDSPISLWGLPPRQRLERVLRRAGITQILKSLQSVPGQSSVLLIRGDYLYDDRVIKTLIKRTHTVLQVGPPESPVTVAAIVPASRASEALELFNPAAPTQTLTNMKIETPETLCSAFEERLRKSDPPFVLPVTKTTSRDLEELLFAWSYKGVTDLVTKWAWPRPARWCTRWCARFGITPNQVTFIGFVLVILATALFANGKFGWGLLAGWVMTFLDTVDGKLARVTVTSSRFGHLFDHVIDLVHPPVWYVAWGLGLHQMDVLGFSRYSILGVIVAGYVIGRLVELAFTLWLGSFGIFCWQPVDSYFRLITARRNPNLILLTAGAVAGYAAMGLLAVAVWTALTSLFLFIRLLMAAYTRIVSGPLHTWLMDVGERFSDRSWAVRLFTRRTAIEASDNHE